MSESAELRKEMREFQAKLERDLRKDLREVKASLEFFNKEFEDRKKERDELAKVNKELQAANEKLLEECQALRTQVLQLEDRVTFSEQYSRNRNLEIKGIPFSEDENLPDALDKIGEALNEPIAKSDIEICHRVPAKKPNTVPNIVVQFKSRPKRDAVLQKARKMRLSTEDLGFSPNSPLFINEHLCPALKRVLGMAIEQKKAKGWKFVWTSNGRVLARKDESSSILYLRNAQDVEKMV